MRQCYSYKDKPDVSALKQIISGEESGASLKLIWYNLFATFIPCAMFLPVSSLRCKILFRTKMLRPSCSHRPSVARELSQLGVTRAELPELRTQLSSGGKSCNRVNSGSYCIWFAITIF